MLKTAGKIITANIWFEMQFMQFRRSILAKSLIRHGLQDMGVDREAQKLLAIVNHGRWLVICPDCGGAEYAWEEGYMMCMSCFNSKLGHKFRPVVFPSKRTQIEELLIQRPLPNRNWILGETLADLHAENELHQEELLRR